MTRRRLLHTGLALTAGSLGSAARAGQFTGKIRKSLKWTMVKNAKDMPLADAFKKLRECGFDGVEPSLASQIDADEWIAASKASGLIIDGMVGGRIENLHEGIDLTKKLGGDSLLVVCRYDQTQTLDENWTTCRDALKAAAPHAEKQGIKLLIENVWMTFLTSAYDFVKFIDDVGSPWVQIHFDVGNLMRFGVAEHWLQVIGKRAQKLDIKEWSDDVANKEGLRKALDVPLGEGSIHWPAVRAELAKLNYTGWAAAEIKGGDWPHLADIAKRMDRVLDL